MEVTFDNVVKVGYRRSDSTRALASEVDGVVTSTKPLPALAQGRYRINDHDGSACQAVVTLVLDRFGEEDEGDLRVGVASMGLEAFDSVDEPAEIPVGLLAAITVSDITIAAVRTWSWNSDDSDVTEAQAEELLQEGAQPVETKEEKWRRASEAYLRAKSTGQPTTQAVIDEVGLLSNQTGAARQVISRAANKGILAEVAREMELSHFLTEKQRNQPREQDS